MKEGSLISSLQTVLKTIAVVGFLATGTLMLGVTYRGYVKLPNEKKDDLRYKLLYIGISMFVILAVIFMYFILF